MRIRFSGVAFATLLSTLPVTAANAQSVPTGAAAARYDADFNAWLKKEIWPEARKAGVSQQTLDATLSGLTINWKLPDLVIPGQKAPKEQRWVAQAASVWVRHGEKFAITATLTGYWIW